MHVAELCALRTHRASLQASTLPVCLVRTAWAQEQLCLDVLGRVVGGQLLVALKVGGTCFD